RKLIGEGFEVHFDNRVSYRHRRAALDKSYRGRSSTTKTSDNALLLLCAMMVGALHHVGGDNVSFLTGLLVGMTLVQIFFHRFSEPLAPATAPPDPSSPIKTMSYAIQAQPGLAWKELASLSLLLAGSLVSIFN